MRLLRDSWGDIHPIKALFWALLIIVVGAATFWHFTVSTQAQFLLKTEGVTLEGKYQYEKTSVVVTGGDSPVGIPIKSKVYVIYFSNGMELEVEYKDFKASRPGMEGVMKFWKQGWYEWQTWHPN